MDTKMKVQFVEAKREFATISIESIKDTPAPTSKARQQSLIELGQIEPIRLRAIDAGLYEIIDGRRRLADLIANGAIEVEAFIETIDDARAALHGLVLNVSRSHSPMVEARLLAQLIEKGYTQQQLAVILGVSQGLIAQRLGLLDLTPELQEALELGRMTLTAARSARKLPKPGQAELAQIDKITVQAAQDALRGHQSEMIDLSAIDIPALPSPASHTITLTPAQLAALGTGQEITAEVDGRRVKIITA